MPLELDIRAFNKRPVMKSTKMVVISLYFFIMLVFWGCSYELPSDEQLRSSGFKTVGETLSESTGFFKKIGLIIMGFCLLGLLLVLEDHVPWRFVKKVVFPMLMLFYVAMIISHYSTGNFSLAVPMTFGTSWCIYIYIRWHEWTDGLERIGFLVGFVFPILLFVIVLATGLFIILGIYWVIGFLTAFLPNNLNN